MEPKYNQQKILFGTCVQIERLDQRHLPDLEKHFENDLFQFYPRTDYRQAKEFCEENWECEQSGNFEAFAIIDLTSRAAIGCVEYSGIDKLNRKLEIGGSWLGKQYQGGPWNTEVKLLLLKEAFEARNLLRVQFTTDSLNLQSQAALKKIGATFEGMLRNHSIQPNGRVRHNVYFSVIKEEWQVVKALLEKRLDEKMKKQFQ